MSFTSLLVTEAGVVLREQHRARLGLECAAAFDDFSRRATPGAWRVWSNGPLLRTESRPPSQLRDGLSVRRLPSPVVRATGALPKASPSPWDQVRVPGLVTLLTSADGSELYEACVAAVLWWNGSSVVTPPADRPRVASSAVAQLRLQVSMVETVIPSSAQALLLVNAVGLTCLPEGSTFPVALRAQLHELLAATASRP